MHRCRPRQGDGSATRMTTCHDEPMRTSRRLRVTRSGMAHIRGSCLNRKIKGARYQAGPGWPPDEVCADSTRYKGSFDDRDREGLRLLSPSFQEKVLKLQKDLAEAKAESRHFRARQVDSPVVTANRPRFTSTPVPRYDGISDWDQYREVFEAIVCLNGWDELMAALQLLAHLDGEALNVALLVPERQRRQPGVLLETLSAHYTSPGRLAIYRRKFEQMTRPPGEDPAVFAIALETLARRAFADVDASVRVQLVHDKFIAGQRQCALRRHLDSAGTGYPDIKLCG